MMPAWAANDLACETFEQKNDLENPWVCPELDSKLDTVLSDVNVESGEYVCEYYYPTAGALATSCSYLSKTYKEALNTKLNSLHKSIVKGITDSGSVPGKDEFKILQSEEYPKTSGELESIDNTIDSDKTDVGQFFSDVGTLISKIYPFYNDIKSKNYYMEGLNKTKSPKNEIKNSYNDFVKPYESGLTDTSKRDTFSNFIMGMVTLDTAVINGYGAHGSPVLTDWSSSLGSNLELPKSEKNATAEINTDLANINAWVDIFKQKVWGFYYNLQRRFDLGFDIISTQLLFIMMVFFAMTMAIRSGARYVTNRENGHSSGEIKINEVGIMRTLGILATVFTFFISVPYQDSSKPKPTTMQTNGSLSKELIQYAMEEGSNFGTMMADLGTDAFLNHIVHKQGLENTEKNNVIASLMSMAYYFPAMQIVNVCRIQSGMPDDVIASGANQYTHSQYFEKNYKNNIDFTKDNSDTNTQMVGINEQLCAKMFGRTQNKLQKILEDFEALEGMIKVDMYVRAQATASLIGNHIKMQKALGWMNIASVPYTYFMMKYQHLFYQPSLDYDKIHTLSKKYVKNLGIRNQTDTLNDTLWIKDKTEIQARVADAKSAAEKNRAEFSRFAVYNFLPGFTSIRNELLQRMQSLYSDILRLSRNNETGKLESFKKFLHNLINRAKTYSPNINGLDANFIKNLTDEVNRGIGSAKNADPVTLHKAFIKISYFAGMAIWKSGFIIVFLSAIAMIIGLKIVLYVINVMVHFFISPFIVVWAFVASTDNGMAKVKNYLRDTLIYMLYPTIIVVGVFVFIFAYELFYSIYGFITSMLIESQMLSIENAISASGSGFSSKDGEMGYMAIYALKDITEILIDLLSVYVAFLTINKFPELVLKMMGVGDSAVMMLPQASEAIQSKGGGNVNPLSR